MAINIYQNGSKLVVGKIVAPAVSNNKKLQKFFDEVGYALAQSDNRHSVDNQLRTIVQKNKSMGAYPQDSTVSWWGRQK